MKEAIKHTWRRFRSNPGVNEALTDALRPLVKAGAFPWAPAHLPRLGAVQYEIPDGQRLVLQAQGDDLANQIYWHGSGAFEPETVRMFWRLSKNSRGVIDVGAHIGLYSMLAAKANPGAEVCAMEPLLDVTVRLIEHLRANHCNVRVFGAAAGAVSGSGTIYRVRQGGIPSSSSLDLGFMQSLDPAPRGEPIITRTLDGLPRNRPVDLIKIDVETAEPEVLKGAVKTLRYEAPDIICEVLPEWETGPALEGILEGLGYRYYLLTDAGPKRRARIRGHRVWRNYLFTLKDL